MSLSLYQASVGSFQSTLTAFLSVLDKAAAHAEAAKFDPAIYATLRLRPNMFAFPRQVQSFCDQAKNGASRLAGVEPPKFEDKETTIAELKARIEATLEVLAKIDRAAVDAAAEREIVFPIGASMKARMTGADYLLHWSLPNFYFHVTTAYDLLREAGVEIGKRDYLGQPPGLTLV